jgi:hypothetical protein
MQMFHVGVLNKEEAEYLNYTELRTMKNAIKIMV